MELFLAHTKLTRLPTMTLSSSCCMALVSVSFLFLLYLYRPRTVNALEPRAFVSVSESTEPIRAKVTFYMACLKLYLLVLRRSFLIVFVNGDVPTPVYMTLVTMQVMRFGRPCALCFMMQGSSSGTLRGATSST